MNKCIGFVAGVVGVSICGSASAIAPSQPTVIYSEITTSPTGQVPGLPAGTFFDSFDRIYRSPDGTHWIMSASSDLATAQDEVIITGLVGSASGTVVVQEGVTATPAGNVGLINRFMSINDSGQYAFATNTNGPSTSDEVIIKWDGANFVNVAQEGKELPSPFATEFYGSTLDSPNIYNNGDVGYRAPFTTGTLDSDFDDFLISGSTIVAQEGVTVPGNQAGGASETWDSFDTENYFSNSDTQYLAQGDLTGDTGSDDVVVYSGNVVVQEGNPITSGSAGGPLDNVETISEVYMDSAGNWMARGDFDSQQDWLAMNGDVIALTGDAVPGGLAGESYSDAIFSSTFFSMVSNNNGDFVIGATTDNPDDLADAVLVYNNQSVIARQGDPVDVDGNGLFDDDAYIDIFNNDDAFLTDDGEYWFTAELMDANGASLGQALIHFQVPAPAALALLGLAGLTGRPRRRR